MTEVTADRRMHYRVVTIEADGTERRGELFDNIGDAVVEVTALNNARTDLDDPVGYEVRPVLR